MIVAQVNCCEAIRVDGRKAHSLSSVLSLVLPVEHSLLKEHGICVTSFFSFLSFFLHSRRPDRQVAILADLIQYFI